MKLITPELEHRFKEVGSQEDIVDQLVLAKFFSPIGSATWYAFEYDPSTNCCFGYVKGLGSDEYGYFSIEEMEEVSLPMGLKIERDLYFGEKRISEHCPELAPMIKRSQELRDMEDKKDKEQDLER